MNQTLFGQVKFAVSFNFPNFVEQFLVAAITVALVVATREGVAGGELKSHHLEKHLLVAAMFANHTLPFGIPDKHPIDATHAVAKGNLGHCFEPSSQLMLGSMIGWKENMQLWALVNCIHC